MKCMWAVLAACLSVIVVSMGRSAAPTRTRRVIVSGPDYRVTFTQDVAPVIFQFCARCHRPGESGPFPLLTYEDVKKHARQIAIVTETRFMLPWLPEPQELKFADETRLSDNQIAAFKTWVDEGMPEGDPKDLSPQPEFVSGWQLGKPNLIVKAEKPYQLPPSGNDQYWNFIFRTPVNQARWLRAMEIRPGENRLVHHANTVRWKRSQKPLVSGEPMSVRRCWICWMARYSSKGCPTGRPQYSLPLSVSRCSISTPCSS
jgi:hypothetical protein